jgi:chromosome partitioning protein
VANRVRKSMPAYQPLERFLNSLNLPLLTRLNDSDAFLKGAESGVGIFEMDYSLSMEEREQFLPIARWVENQEPPRATLQDKVVSLPLNRYAEIFRTRPR